MNPVPESGNLNQLMALNSDPPDIQPHDVDRFALDVYGLGGDFQSLSGECDRNFLFHIDDGRKLILKFSHPHEDPAVLDFQCQALAHIRTHAPALPVPRIYPTLDGHCFQTVEPDGYQAVMLHAQTCIDGVPIPQEYLNHARLRQVGILTAQLDLALQGFEHPAAQHKLAWDLANAEQLLPATESIKNSKVRSLIEEVLHHFVATVTPQFCTMRKQVVHADLHFGNLHTLPEEDAPISGIVDFGDMLKAPLVVEVSTALAEVAISIDNPMSAMAQLLAGYESILPLEAHEHAVLQSCIMTRLAITYVIFSWRLVNQGMLSSAYDGFEDDYSKALATLNSLGPEEFLAAIQTGR